MLGLLAILGLSLQSQDLQPRFLEFVSRSIPGSAEFIEDNIPQIVRFRNAVGIGAIIGMFWLGRAVFAAAARAINRAWGITRDPPFYWQFPQQIGMTITLGSLQILSMKATSLIQLANNEAVSLFGRRPFLEIGVGYVSLYLIPFLLTTITFALLYRFVPNRPMRWAYVWPGVLAATFLFELFKFLFVVYLEKIADYTLLYGSMASVIVFMFWAYVSSFILLGEPWPAATTSGSSIPTTAFSNTTSHSGLIESRFRAKGIRIGRVIHPPSVDSERIRLGEPGSQLPEVADLADHVNLVDGLRRPSDHVDPVLEVRLLNRLAFAD